MPDSPSTLVERAAPWLFLLAHPGHELRVHHVLERVKPAVAVLTDGSGATGIPRIDQTRTLLAATGAHPAPVFGPFSDREAYAALMDADAGPFVALRDRLAGVICERGVRAVLVDAAEGYNPVHDICHWLGRGAAGHAKRAGGADVDVFEVDLVAHPDGAGSGLRLALDDRAFARKLQAVTAYDALAQEAGSAFAEHGRDAFRTEFLRSVEDVPAPPSSWVPYYEEVGESRLRAGRYAAVLRYGRHVKPVIDALLESPSLHAEALGSLHE